MPRRTAPTPHGRHPRLTRSSPRPEHLCGTTVRNIPAPRLPPSLWPDALGGRRGGARPAGGREVPARHVRQGWLQPGQRDPTALPSHRLKDPRFGWAGAFEAVLEEGKAELMEQPSLDRPIVIDRHPGGGDAAADVRGEVADLRDQPQRWRPGLHVPVALPARTGSRKRLTATLATSRSRSSSPGTSRATRA